MENERREEKKKNDFKKMGWGCWFANCFIYLVVDLVFFFSSAIFSIGKETKMYPLWL